MVPAQTGARRLLVADLRRGRCATHARRLPSASSKVARFIEIPVDLLPFGCCRGFLKPSLCVFFAPVPSLPPLFVLQLHSSSGSKEKSLRPSCGPHRHPVLSLPESVVVPCFWLL